MRSAALGLALVLGAGPALAGSCRPDVVELRGPWGTALFHVELAETAQDRATGLMNRAEMARSAGMLFVYDHPQPVAFWMKNTLIPLDMVFLDATGTVERVHSNARPEDETPIPGGEDIQFVLEINGGVAQRLGIGPGTQMQNPAVPAATAAWPCD